MTSWYVGKPTFSLMKVPVASTQRQTGTAEVLDKPRVIVYFAMVPDGLHNTDWSIALHKFLWVDTEWTRPSRRETHNTTGHQEL